MRYRYALGAQHISLNDPVALGHIFQHTDTFGKMYRTKRILSDILGDGLLTADPVNHRRQRRVLNPAFSVTAIREMVPDFFGVAYKLRDAVAAEAGKPSLDEKKPQEVEVHELVSHATLDIIGVSGFGARDLSSSDSALGTSYADLLTARNQANIFDFLQITYPAFKNLPTKATRKIKDSRTITDKLGHDIVAERKKALEAAGDTDTRDMLSRLLRANMAPDLKPEQRMTDDEVMGQITTLMFAGHETTSTAMSWALWRLAIHQDIQAKLRAELMTIDTDEPSIDALNALTYLEKFVHEVLRLDDPVALSYRIALKDAVVPLSAPITGRDGSTIEALTVKKGTMFHTPIISLNRSKDIWGDDADKFNPDRDTNPSTQVPGMYGNLLTFLSGPHHCIGYRFALAELKVLLFVLVRSFNFELPAEPYTIVPHTLITMRPSINGKISMRLVVKPVAGQ